MIPPRGILHSMGRARRGLQPFPEHQRRVRCTFRDDGNAIARSDEARRDEPINGEVERHE